MRECAKDNTTFILFSIITKGLIKQTINRTDGHKQSTEPVDRDLLERALLVVLSHQLQHTIYY